MLPRLALVMRPDRRGCRRRMAASLDPLSLQGILNAVYSGMIAAHATVAHLGGDRAALAGYRQRLGGIFTTYLSRRRDYYPREQRWADRSFWQRRIAT